MPKCVTLLSFFLKLINLLNYITKGAKCLILVTNTRNFLQKFFFRRVLLVKLKNIKNIVLKTKSNLVVFRYQSLSPEDWSCPSVSVYTPTITDITDITDNNICCFCL